MIYLQIFDKMWLLATTNAQTKFPEKMTNNTASRVVLIRGRNQHRSCFNLPMRWLSAISTRFQLSTFQLESTSISRSICTTMTINFLFFCERIVWFLMWCLIAKRRQAPTSSRKTSLIYCAAWKFSIEFVCSLVCIVLSNFGVTAMVAHCRIVTSNNRKNANVVNILPRPETNSRLLI